MYVLCFAKQKRIEDEWAEFMYCFLPWTIF